MTSVVASQPQRVALLLQYRGEGFHGWQRQPRERSVQQDVEDTLAKVLGQPVILHGAGRTDTGVHAAGQVAHFTAVTRIPGNRWASVLNTRLPEDILVRASAPVGLDWHARFSASWRRYRYTLYTDPVPNLFVSPWVWHHYHKTLDVIAIRVALEELLGYHHLSAFRRSGSSRPHSWVDIQKVHCQQEGPFIHIEVQASGFLYGMMRLLVGLLVELGRGNLSSEDFRRIWREERKSEVKYAAPARGLCLLSVGYPENPFASDVVEGAMPKPTFAA
ncbi:tRNA pseudouridine(38-40) synthase TruA [Leptolyngbya sp. FACHB-261]|uniref:tRNA pseudouridine(38-40) synthase TruA n=1 Tax=Leptolyngbya sp. FACHB-261 TaxID=2692806 RepID=UPI00168276A6|nr:tRNA pseudouridine(38-40) synthase TruA [Leptolyngbya sp. FACHB-261]MBD2105249.1 tRNA pseudouridine(38-40) synthase TruA [Leptolyngbya sp. FACHB-261]